MLPTPSSHAVSLYPMTGDLSKEIIFAACDKKIALRSSAQSHNSSGWHYHSLASHNNDRGKQLTPACRTTHYDSNECTIGHQIATSHRSLLHSFTNRSSTSSRSPSPRASRLGRLTARRQFRHNPSRPRCQKAKNNHLHGTQIEILIARARIVDCSEINWI